MGRKKTIDKREDLTIEKLIDEYERDKNVTIGELSKHYGISSKTIGKYFKEAGFKTKRGIKPGMHKKHPHTSSLVMWVKEHPEVQLPRSPKRIADMTGVTVSTVKSYLHREKKNFYKRIRSLPDLRTTNLVFKKNNTKYRARDFTSYVISGDYFSGLLKIQATLEDNSLLSLRVHLDHIQTNLR